MLVSKKRHVEAIRFYTDERRRLLERVQGLEKQVQSLQDTLDKLPGRDQRGRFTKRPAG